MFLNSVRRPIVLLALALLLAVLSACTRPPCPDCYPEWPPDHDGFLRKGPCANDLVYQHYFTWVNYNGWGPKEKAVFAYDGAVVGTGEEGFKNVLEILRGLPTDTRVLVFPDYDFLTYVTPGGGYPFGFPWSIESHNALDKLGRNKLQIILSAMDQGELSRRVRLNIPFRTTTRPAD